MVKNLPAVQKTRIQSLDGDDPLEKKWVPTPVFLPGESMDRGAWQATVHGVAELGLSHDWAANTLFSLNLSPAGGFGAQQG